MSAATLALLAVAAFVTATLSGVFGMGGGMVLMALLASILPVPEAMLLHGATQLVANGTRAGLLRGHIEWRVVVGHALGALVALTVFARLRVAPDTRTVFALLGALPLLVAVLPMRLVPSLRRRGVPGLVGAVATSGQLVAGVSGPLLDAFFVQSTSGRRAVVATKAAVSVLGHASKLVYFALLLPTADEAVIGTLPPVAFPLAAACAAAGTRTGRAVLERLSDTGFRRHSRRLLLVLAAICLLRALA